MSTSGTDICALKSDQCDRDVSECEPTPGVGLNYRCNCNEGYTQVDDITCALITTTTTSTTAIPTTTTITTPGNATTPQTTTPQITTPVTSKKSM